MKKGKNGEKSSHFRVEIDEEGNEIEIPVIISKKKSDAARLKKRVNGLFTKSEKTIDGKSPVKRKSKEDDTNNKFLKVSVSQEVNLAFSNTGACIQCSAYQNSVMHITEEYFKVKQQLHEREQELHYANSMLVDTLSLNKLLLDEIMKNKNTNTVF